MKKITPIPMGEDAEMVLRSHEDGVRCMLAVPECDGEAVMEVMRGAREFALVLDLHTGHEVRILRGGHYSTSAVCELWRPAPVSDHALDRARSQYGYVG
jgi:hypothetical protein